MNDGMALKRQWKHELGLTAGEWVEVRSKPEGLSTLDPNGRLDELPFRPGMLAFCGKRFRVWKRAHKTCDTVNKTGGRRIAAAVHLEELRCDGAGHGGCEAGCLIFWKEAWLKRVAGPDGPFVQSEVPTAGRTIDDTCPTENDIRALARTVPADT